MILALATVALLICGIGVEERQEQAVPFRYARIHVRFGTLLSGAFAFMTVALIVFFVFGVLAFGLPASTPSSAGVLPPSPGLAVLANVDQGCGKSAGPQMVCSPGDRPADRGGVVRRQRQGRAGPQEDVAPG